jgi:hypothetical protein
MTESDERVVVGVWRRREDEQDGERRSGVSGVRLERGGESGYGARVVILPSLPAVPARTFAAPRNARTVTRLHPTDFAARPADCYSGFARAARFPDAAGPGCRV